MFLSDIHFKTEGYIVSWIQYDTVNAGLSGCAINEEFPIEKGSGRRNELIICFIYHYDEIPEASSVILNRIRELAAVVKLVVCAFQRLLCIHIG